MKYDAFESVKKSYKGKEKADTCTQGSLEYERHKLWKHLEKFSFNQDRSAENSSQREGPILYPTRLSALQDCTTLMDFIHIATQVDVHKRKFKAEFEQTISWFLKDFLEFSIYMPLPPTYQFGRKISLLELYMTVERLGGFDSVNKYDLWVEVALRMGYIFGLPKLKKEDEIGKILRIVYNRYLEMINWYHLRFKGRELLVKINEDVKAIEKRSNEAWRGGPTSKEEVQNVQQQQWRLANRF
ncbi:putative transcription factor & chromatin remodeling ARID family [Helianthus anomalus]